MKNLNNYKTKIKSDFSLINYLKIKKNSPFSFRNSRMKIDDNISNQKKYNINSNKNNNKLKIKKNSLENFININNEKKKISLEKILKNFSSNNRKNNNTNNNSNTNINYFSNNNSKINNIFSYSNINTNNNSHINLNEEENFNNNQENFPLINNNNINNNKNDLIKNKIKKLKLIDIKKNSNSQNSTKNIQLFNSNKFPTFNSIFNNNINNNDESFDEKIQLLKQKASDPDWLYITVGYFTDMTDGNLHAALRFASEYEQEFQDDFY